MMRGLLFGWFAFGGLTAGLCLGQDIDGPQGQVVGRAAVVSGRVIPVARPPAAAATSPRSVVVSVPVTGRQPLPAGAHAAGSVLGRWWNQAAGELMPQSPAPVPSGAPASAASGCCPPRDPCSRRHRWSLYADWLYLQPRGTDLGFAYPTDEAFGQPLGATEQIDFDYDEEGLRVGGRLELDGGGRWIGFTGSHFSAGTRASAYPPGDMTLQTLLLASPDPLSADAASSTFARANAEVEFNTYDLDIGKTIYSGGCTSLAAWLGARVGTLDQSLAVTYDDGTVRTAQDLRGAGLRAGIGGQRTIGRLRLFGRSALSLLATDIDVDYQQDNVLDGRVVDFKQDIDRVLPVLDIELGVGLKLSRRVWLGAGYLYSIWFDVVTAPELVPAVQAADHSGEVHDDLSFDGLFTRLEVTW